MSKQKTVTVTLAEPIEFGGAEIKEVTVRRPKVKDLRAVSNAADDTKSEVEQGIAIVAILTGLPAEAIDELDAGDFDKISTVVGDFFPKATARASGEAS